MTRVCARALIFAWCLAVLQIGSSAAQERRGTPGEFDYYVLALSWSPSYCEATSERNGGRGGGGSSEQCGARPFSFVVHGLWPQYERGYPRNCRSPAPRLDRRIVDEMLDLMPARRLIYHQWDAHGTCSGLEAREYFDAVRQARAAVKIPEEFSNIQKYLTVSPEEVHNAFRRANGDLPGSGVVVTCDNRRLREVRVCMTRDLKFRDCSEPRRGACRRDRLVMPPVRGG